MTTSDLRGRLCTPQHVLEFALAGNAILTVVSTATGGRFTYCVQRAKDDRDLWFVALLRGPDNERDYQHLGTLRRVPPRKWPVYYHSKRSRIHEDAPSNKGFAWLWRQVLTPRLPAQVVEVWHEGRCGRCGRRLTVPISIARGLGPECAGVVDQGDLFGSVA